MLHLLRLPFRLLQTKRSSAVHCRWSAPQSITDRATRRLWPAALWPAAQVGAPRCLRAAPACWPPSLDAHLAGGSLAQAGLDHRLRPGRMPSMALRRAPPHVPRCKPCPQPMPATCLLLQHTWACCTARGCRAWTRLARSGTAPACSTGCRQCGRWQSEWSGRRTRCQACCSVYGSP